MKGKIFIGGGGDILDTKNFDNLFFDSLKDGANILYIPIAMGIGLNTVERCYGWFSRLISEHNTNKYFDFKLLTNLSEDVDINKFDAIYVGGGNTYRLLNAVKKAGFDKKIINYIEAGGIYYGGSAGGIILGESLLTVKEENLKKSKNSEGLKVLGQYSIYPHYTSDKYDEVKSISHLNKLKIFAIPENSGVMFENETINIFGNVIEI